MLRKAVTFMLPDALKTAFSKRCREKSTYMGTVIVLLVEAYIRGALPSSLAEAIEKKAHVEPARGGRAIRRPKTEIDEINHQIKVLRKRKDVLRQEVDVAKDTIQE